MATAQPLRTARRAPEQFLRMAARLFCTKWPKYGLFGLSSDWHASCKGALAMKLNHMLLAASCAAALTFLNTGTALAQSRDGREARDGRSGRESRDGRGGGWDISQIRQHVVDRLRQQMDVSDDAEWKLISEKLGKVLDARMEVGFGGMRFGRSQSGESSSSNRGPFGGQSSAEIAALQKAIDAKAPAEEIKAKLERVRAETKAKEAKLAKAQEELRGLLSVRQEAVAVMNGLLK
jgi:hypothetical protein